MKVTGRVFPQALASRAWRDYLRRYGKFRRALILSVTLSILQALALVPIAWFIKLAFDRVSVRSGYLSLLVPCGAILLLVTASSVFSLLARHQSLRITKRVIADIRLELFAKNYELASTFSTTADRSPLHTAIVQDTERLDVGSNAIVVVCIPALMICLIFIAALAFMAPLLLAATAAAIPFVLVSNRFLGRKLRTLVESFRTSFKQFDENVFAALRRTELTRLRGAENIELLRHSRLVDDLRITSGRMAHVATAYSVSQGIIITAVSVATLIIGGGAVSSGQMTVSDLAAYFFILSQLGSNVNALSNAAPQVLAGLISLENISALPSAAPESPSTGWLKRQISGAIEFRNVHFSYGGEAVLRGIDLTIPPGARIAIMGANGSGKTTLGYLLLGIYEPSLGEIVVDGFPLMNFSTGDYRGQIGAVLQDQMIFEGTVRDNIAYGMPRASHEDVERSARCACADRFIQSLPDGYDTMIGQAGVALSGGQSQMLALARALLGKPGILMLDEPTNHLDEATAQGIFNNLKTLDNAPTTVIITHDIELAAQMDSVYRLVDGKLSEVTDLFGDTERALPMRDGNDG